MYIGVHVCVYTYLQEYECPVHLYIFDVITNILNIFYRVQSCGGEVKKFCIHIMLFSSV